MAKKTPDNKASSTLGAERKASPSRTKPSSKKTAGKKATTKAAGARAATKAATKKAPKQAQLQTTKTDASVAEFIANVESEQRRRDAKTIDAMLREVTGEKPTMWGASIIGYGSYEYVNTLGSARWPKIGFSPRKSAMVIYVMPGLPTTDPLLSKLGKYKHGKSCLYIGSLAEVDQGVLRELATRTWQHMSEKYG